jgi:hypothetical protein
MRSFNYLLILAILLTSCNRGLPTKECFDTANVVKLVQTGEMRLPMDSVTSFSATAAFVYTPPNSERSFVVIDNLNQMRIDIFDLSSKQLHKRIKFSADGPNPIPNPSGFYFHNFDSIFLFFNVGQKIYLIDSAGTVKDKMGPLTVWSSDKQMPTVEISGDKRPFILGSDVYFGTYGLAYSDNGAGFIYNLESRNFQVPYQLPSQYERGWWSGLLYDRLSVTHNAKEGIIILSYGADNNLYTVDSSGSLKSYCAKLSQLPGKLIPYSEVQLEFDVHYAKLWKHEALQGGYSYVVYDPWRNLYYRFAFPPVLEAVYSDPSQVWDEPAIVVLNSNFEKVGETKLPKGYLFTVCYVDEHGLNIFNKSKYDVNDDFIYFDVYTVSKF